MPYSTKILHLGIKQGQLKEVPLSAVTSRKTPPPSVPLTPGQQACSDRIFGLGPGYTDAGAIVSQIQTEMANFTELPKGVSVDYGAN